MRIRKLITKAIKQAVRLIKKNNHEEKKWILESVEDYQQNTLRTFNSMEPLSGKKILEIGGNGNFAVAYSLNNLSEQKVFVVNPDKRMHAIIDDKIEVLSEDACNTSFADNSFDLIIGIAVLEHILDMKTFVKEMYRILTPRGKIFLQGGPIWTSALGHHVFIVNEEMNYTFSGNNPIIDFEHLLLNESEMLNKLVTKRQIPENNAAKIVDFIYHSPELNRFSPSTLVEHFSCEPFKEIKVKYDLHGGVIPDQLTEINRISNIYLCAVKPD